MGHQQIAHGVIKSQKVGSSKVNPERMQLDSIKPLFLKVDAYNIAF
jgi:hypothetical protein